MNTVVTRALVLSGADSNSDRIIRLLTEDGTLVAAVARQARRSTKRFGARIQPLTCAEVHYRDDVRSDLVKLSDASVEHAFPIIKSDLTRMALALTMAEVVLHMVAEHGREEGIFPLLLAAWRYLDDPAKPATEDLLLLFELRVLALGGALPDPHQLRGVSADAADTLSDWLSGQWRPLSDAQRRPVARALEGLISDQSGRALKSRAFVDEALGR